jgi:hypothetical protein
VLPSPIITILQLDNHRRLHGILVVMIVGADMHVSADFYWPLIPFPLLESSSQNVGRRGDAGRLGKSHRTPKEFVNSG